ncbi:MAG: hypothetical protein JST02_04870 [Bacteroidetes bacterium]|nr:hypothetical protein [Bacteroidota bacterium]
MKMIKLISGPYPYSSFKIPVNPGFQIHLVGKGKQKVINNAIWQSRPVKATSFMHANNSMN